MDSDQVESQFKTPDGKAIDVVFPDELKKGHYATHVIVSHTSEEYILEFLSVFPSGGSVVGRVILSPSHAKRLMNALNDNIRRYESVFGEIPLKVEAKSQ